MNQHIEPVMTPSRPGHLNVLAPVNDVQVVAVMAAIMLGAERKLTRSEAIKSDCLHVTRSEAIEEAEKILSETFERWKIRQSLMQG